MIDPEKLERKVMNALKSERVGSEPADESEHFYICAACGQAVDMRKLGDVFHHEEEGHQPLPVE